MNILNRGIGEPERRRSSPVSPFLRVPVSLWLLTGSALLFFLPLHLRALWDTDEGRYAEIAREMLLLRDWITPHLNFVVYLEKPPLMYWLTAASFKWFGISVFAARFWCAVFGVGTVWLTFLAGRRWRDKRTGLLAGAVLATSVEFFALTQFLVLDMALTFCTTLALYAIVRFLPSRVARERRNSVLLFAAATAAGTLIKGPVALFIPLMVLVVWMVWRRQGLILNELAWRGPVILWLAIVLPWFIAVSCKNPYFPRFFFIHEHVQRYFTAVHHRMEPVWFFIPVVIVGFVPWIFFLPRAFLSVFNKGSFRSDVIGSFLAVWFLSIFLFFSLSHSKLAGYVLPVFPAIALLAADSISRAWDQEGVPSWMGVGLLCLILFFAVLLFVLKWQIFFRDVPEWSAITRNSAPMTITLGIIVLILAGVWGMRRVPVCIAGILLAQVLFLWQLASLAAVIDPYLSTKAIACRWKELHRASEPLVVYGASYENYFQTLPFYAQNRVAVWGPPGELETGFQHAADAAEWYVPEGQIRSSLGNLPAGAWLATDEEHASQLAGDQSSGHLRIMEKSGRLMLLQKVS
jgi:4-amino-4-deoxy-L-arabinose transferase-like glycosyltransferase